LCVSNSSNPTEISRTMLSSEFSRCLGRRLGFYWDGVAGGKSSHQNMPTLSGRGHGLGIEMASTRANPRAHDFRQFAW
ncbi:MAG: hypothetical protein WDZ51_08935, partial [Pirellulaceae bacterium]